MAVNHQRDEYVSYDKDLNPTIHVNGIESLWSLVKRAYKGVYHYWSPQHLERYGAEFAYRDSVGPVNDFEAIRDVIKLLFDRTMTYRQLVDDNWLTPDRVDTLGVDLEEREFEPYFTESGDLQIDPFIQIPKGLLQRQQEGHPPEDGKEELADILGTTEWPDPFEWSSEWPDPVDWSGSSGPTEWPDPGDWGG